MFTRLIKALMPKEEPFVPLFTAHADCMVAGAKALRDLLTAPEEGREAAIEKVGIIEKQADAISRECLLKLHRAFLTPFDRASILALITAQDDALDLIDDTAKHIRLYGVTRFDHHMTALAQQIEESAKLVAQMVPLLHDFNRNVTTISALCEQLSRVESAADDVLATALTELFANPPQVIELIALKEIYELLESVTDRMDDVGDTVEGILLDHI